MKQAFLPASSVEGSLPGVAEAVEKLLPCEQLGGVPRGRRADALVRSPSFAQPIPREAHGAFLAQEGEISVERVEARVGPTRRRIGASGSPAVRSPKTGRTGKRRRRERGCDKGALAPRGA